MVKSVEVSVTLPDCSAQQLYKAIYDDASRALHQFHAQQNHDHNIKVTPWADGCRTVEFVMQMNVPAMLKKIIGVDVVPVVETQSISWQGVSEFSLRSTPVLNFVGANKFTTSGNLIAADQADGSCLLRCILECSAALPWPMQSTVEGLMGTEAATSIGQYLDFCQAFYATWVQEQKQRRPAAAAAAAAALRIPSLARQPTEGEEVFYDLPEEGEEEAGVLPVPEAAEELVPYQAPRLEDIIVSALHAIQASTAETAASLKEVEQLLRRVDASMASIAGAGSGGTRQVVTAAQRGRSGKNGIGGAGAGQWLGTLTTVALVFSAGTYVYLRYYRQAGGAASR